MVVSFRVPQGPEKGLQCSACVYPRDAGDNCRGGSDRVVCVSLLPITLIRFVVFPPSTMAAKALRERKVE